MRVYLLFAFFVVAVHALDERQGTLTKIAALKNLFVRYDQNLDKVVPFKELKKSLNELQTLEEKYNVRVKRKLNQAITLGLRATDEYYIACDKIYVWCVRTSSSVENVLKGQKYLSLNDTADTASEVVKLGLDAVRTSLENLQKVQTYLTDVASALQTIPADLEEELQELVFKYKHDSVELQKKEKIATGIVALIGGIAALALQFVFGPNPGLFALSIRAALLVASVPAAILNRNTDPNRDEKMKITQVFYERLIIAIDYTRNNVTVVKQELAVEIYKISEMETKMQGTNNIILAGHVEKEAIVNALSNLISVTNDFISRHDDNIKLESVRRKRHDISSPVPDIKRHEVHNHLNETAEERKNKLLKSPINTESEIPPTIHDVAIKSSPSTYLSK